MNGYEHLCPPVVFRFETIVLRYRIEELVDVHLIMPMPLGYDRKIRERSRIQFHTFADQLPADPGNDLLAPSVEEPREGNATGCGGASQLAAPFDQDGSCSGSGGLNGRDCAGGTTTHNQDIGPCGHALRWLTDRLSPVESYRVPAPEPTTRQRLHRPKCVAGIVVLRHGQFPCVVGIPNSARARSCQSVCCFL